MAYPGHPKSSAVDAMLLDFRSIKEIHMELGVSKEMVHHRIANTNLRKVYLTPDEVAMIAKHRAEKNN